MQADIHLEVKGASSPEQVAEYVLDEIEKRVRETLVKKNMAAMQAEAGGFGELGVDFASLHTLVEIGLNLGQAMSHCFRLEIAENHVTAGHCAHLGDSVTHGPRTYNSYFFDVHQLAPPIRSMTVATPCPTPTQRVATPNRPPVLSKTFRSVVRMRAPEQPKGWPSAMAPPQR